ncbi:hypothetical protein PHYBLDRAFT_170521 [Phycomyces blakesleeanus NRRL 1555(-)]|uniref:Uncharacterized protein n=1 Tax=Phycomyces blakesleeanus (strain ATCC 8743b / DSM 1359 / FGSC 10004 / NBRC 33097 / NRRL 1555) TaxID=763407 RepID=A0A162TZN0_PHYB8|nr:hypothetical protein PHYBLDRAFT_170521 [Phycomyces blakesleeanus NRRL 1555(-)]OAD71133.1 hypothetical protein PHYBLDRAFT_170521 [Phycomyces blakesleeanus NRRL 1555(-)]|eukprot:XP_018289173.1 hypothetical protein PHYBLDRAFT_170521 [Phycomyces blakesleeanus NRRL 1555(-)]
MNPGGARSFYLTGLIDRNHLSGARFLSLNLHGKMACPKKIQYIQLIAVCDLNLYLTSVMQSNIPIDQFNAIIDAANMDPVPMSAYASDISNALHKAPLSAFALRETLYDAGYSKVFVPVAYYDANFMEITIRYLLFSYLIINLVSQLYIANNGETELGRLKREVYSTDQSKFDRVLLKVGKKSISPGLIEFSGEINDRTSSRKKNSKYIENLYSSMIKVMNGAKANRMFCMGCYYIYFGKLLIVDDTMDKRTKVTMVTPNTPRKPKAFIKALRKNKEIKPFCTIISTCDHFDQKLVKLFCKTVELNTLFGHKFNYTDDLTTIDLDSNNERQVCSQLELVKQKKKIELNENNNGSGNEKYSDSSGRSLRSLYKAKYSQFKIVHRAKLYASEI